MIDSKFYSGVCSKLKKKRERKKEKTLTLAEMRSIWLHTASVEVKHRLHNLPQRLVLYQMEVLVKNVNT